MYPLVTCSTQACQILAAEKQLTISVRFPAVMHQTGRFSADATKRIRQDRQPTKAPPLTTVPKLRVFRIALTKLVPIHVNLRLTVARMWNGKPAAFGRATCPKNPFVRHTQIVVHA